MVSNFIMVIVNFQRGEGPILPSLAWDFKSVHELTDDDPFTWHKLRPYLLCCCLDPTDPLIFSLIKGSVSTRCLRMRLAINCQPAEPLVC